MSTDPVRRLLDQLADPNPRVRRLALVALDDRLTVGCLEPLLEIVQDPDPTVRRPRRLRYPIGRTALACSPLFPWATSNSTR